MIGVRGKVPYLIEGPGFIVTDNDDYTLELILDSEWDAYTVKTVVYVFDNGKCILHPITGNEDSIPVIQTFGKVCVGITAGDIRTSSWVPIPLRPSVRQKGRVQIPEPEPDAYDQIMEMINEALARPQILSGAGEPTTATVGKKDDLYVDSDSKCLYWCSGWEYDQTRPGEKLYRWVLLSTGTPGTDGLVATYDAETGELAVSGGTITFDEDTGELTVNGTPLTFDEATGEMKIGG